MTAEFWSTIASVGTFIVITATAVAAVLQLRHMGAGNKVTYIQTFLAEYEGPVLRDAFRFVRSELSKKLEERAFRDDLRSRHLSREKHPEIAICNFFDQWGLYYRDGVIDRTSFMRVNARIVDDFWKRLEPVIALSADTVYGNTAFQQFEYLAIKARRWIALHPAGDFPADEKRIPLTDPWKEADEGLGNGYKATLTDTQNIGSARE